MPPRRGPFVLPSARAIRLAPPPVLAYLRTMTVSLKIASWNINSVRARLPIVERLLDEQKPDILCLQETKAANGDFPATFFADRGYTDLHLHGQRMHHGVAIISRIPLRETVSHDWQGNDEARHIGVELPGGVRLENVYVPAGGDVADVKTNPKFRQKMNFLDRMTAWSEALRQPTILVGDFNIAPLPSDVWSHEQLLDVVSHTPMEVEKLDRLQASHGWVDLGRRTVPAPERLFTWWSYRGRRLDHVWLSPELSPAAVHCDVLEDARSWPKPSDHAPLVARFAW